MRSYLITDIHGGPYITTRHVFFQRSVDKKLYSSALLQNLQACTVTWRKLLEKESAQIPGTCFVQISIHGCIEFQTTTYLANTC